MKSIYTSQRKNNYQQKKKIKELLKADITEGQRSYVKGLEKYRKHYKTLSEKQENVLNEMYENLINA